VIEGLDADAERLVAIALALIDADALAIRQGEGFEAEDEAVLTLIRAPLALQQGLGVYDDRLREDRTAQECPTEGELVQLRLILIDTASEVYRRRAILPIIIEKEWELCRTIDTDLIIVAKDDVAVIVIELEGAETQDFVVGDTGILLDIDVVLLVLQLALEAAL